MCCGAHVIRGRMAMGGRRWSTLSGCFHSVRTCAGPAAERSVRAVQPGRDCGRAARLAKGARLSAAQLVWLGRDRFDHAEAVRADRPLSSDAGRSRRRHWGLRRGFVVRSRRCRTALSQSGSALQGRSTGRGGNDVAAGSHAEAPERLVLGFVGLMSHTLSSRTSAASWPSGLIATESKSIS